MTAPRDPSDPAFWEAEWAADPGWDLGATPPPLLRALSELPVGTDAIVLGCGRGHEARALVRRGWPRVVGIDFAEAALREAREAEALDAPWEPRPRVEWRRQDVFTLPDTDAAAFDLAVEHACAIAISPARRPAWARAAAAVLRPGGRLLALLSLKPRTGGPPYELRRPEVEALLADAGLLLERSEMPGDSVPSRRGLEWLVVARRG
ncbi:MAG: methyltransferase domain-containing protein [Anaeromyxobacter sp.]